MSKTVVLAVDVARHLPERNVAAAVDMARELAHDTGYQVVVLHVHEFAVGRFGRLQVDCGSGEGEQLVAGIVADLKNEGVDATPRDRRGQLRAYREEDSRRRR